MCSVCGTQLNMTVSRSYLHVIYMLAEIHLCHGWWFERFLHVSQWVINPVESAYERWVK